MNLIIRTMLKWLLQVFTLCTVYFCTNYTFLSCNKLVTEQLLFFCKRHNSWGVPILKPLLFAYSSIFFWLFWYFPCIYNHQLHLLDLSFSSYIYVLPISLLTMKRSSASKSAAANNDGVKGRSIDWELRPGGMLVQKRQQQPLESSSSSSPMIKIKVSHGSYHYEVTVPSQSTFGKHRWITCILGWIPFPFFIYSSFWYNSARITLLGYLVWKG